MYGQQKILLDRQIITVSESVLFIGSPLFLKKRTLKILLHTLVL